jgi:protein O-GlcNAc transferase
LTCNPTFVPAVKNLGSVLYAGGDYERAIKMFERELSLTKSPDPDTLLDLGDAYRDRAHSKSSATTRDNDLNQALAFYQKAIDIAPGMAAIYNHRGVYYFQQRQLERAETDIRHAIELKKDYAAAYYNLALVENELKKPAEAAEAFRGALQYETDSEYQKQIRQKLTALEALSPAAQGTQLEQAYALLSRHDWSRAADLLKQATTGYAAQDPVAYNNLGYALARQGLQKESIAAYARAVELDPELAEAQLNLGQARRLSGDLAGAEECLRQALKTSGGMNAGAHNALGLVYKARNHLAEAMAEYKLAIMQSGDTLPIAHLNLAIASEHADGHRGEAIAHYEQYLRQAPSGANAGYARNRLRALKAG